MGLQSWTSFPLGTQCSACNELADSIFNVLALSLGFSDTRNLGEDSKKAILWIFEFSSWDHISIQMTKFEFYCTFFQQMQYFFTP